MQASLEEIASVKRRNEKEWLALDGVVGVGLGKTSDQQHGIIISVKTVTGKLRSAIPESIDGVRIEIRETGEIRAL